MKKYLSMILIYFSICLPANANDWIEVQNGIYIKPKSVKKYQSILNINDRKTIWAKYTDKKFIQSIDKEANTILVNYLIDCNTSKLSVETGVVYYDNKNPKSDTINEYQLQWSSIVPDTFGEFLFRLVCKGDLNEI